MHRQALDMSIQALSGFMDVTGFQDGPPTKGGPVLSDFIAGLYLAVGILAAYAYRQRTGMGQYLSLIHILTIPGIGLYNEHRAG